jgi:hypothetical protein
MNDALKYMLFFCILGFNAKSPAQTTITSGGSNSSGPGGSVSFTVGQIDYTNNSSYFGSISQGVQHPYEISIMTGIENNNILLTWSVYPNPVNHELTLKIDNYDSENYSYKLFDVNGNLVGNNNITDNITIISLANKISGIYFLQVRDNSKALKTFKIIKN